MDIDALLNSAVAKHASDLHLSAESPPVYRVFGEVVRDESPPLGCAEIDDAFSRLATPRDREALLSHGQVDFSYSLPGVGRFRVNAFKQRGSTALSVRILWPKVPSLGELSLPLVVAELAMKPSGLVIVAGPAGSGKSSTLAGMVNLINENKTCHVITLEDPIEYLHKHNRSVVNQREVGADTPSFEEGLGAALRQDPDVILVGEVRDLECVRLALTAAETGHLVLASLHTTSAAQAVERIIDVFPPHQQQQVRVQLASALAGIVVQQLVPRMDKPGRIVASEIMTGTPAVRNLIREGRTHQLYSAIQTGAKYGMRTMEQSLRDLYEKHLISMEEFKARSGIDPQRDL